MKITGTFYVFYARLKVIGNEMTLLLEEPINLGSLKSRFEAFVAACSDTKSAKDFDNVIHSPLTNIDEFTNRISSSS